LPCVSVQALVFKKSHYALQSCATLQEQKDVAKMFLMQKTSDIITMNLAFKFTNITPKNEQFLLL